MSYHKTHCGSSASFYLLQPCSPSPLYAPTNESDTECALGGQPKEQLASSAHLNANAAASSASLTFSAI